MSILERMADRGHERIAFHQDPASGLRCIVAVHDTTLGPGFGGARRWHYATEADALHDVLRLSEGMTWKSAAAGIPMGGGKAVILLPKPRHPATEAEARAMGRFVESLGGAYISAEDVGLSPQYVDWMSMETRYVSGTASLGGDPSPFTARGVVNAMKAALAYAGRPVDFSGVHVVIQGAGNVGSNVASILAESGAKLTVADIDAARAKALADRVGAALADPEGILATECDVLCPCALGGVLDAGAIAKLRCGIVCGGANNILGDYDEDGVALKARDVVYVPDFIANAGGVIELAGIYVGMSEADRARRIDDVERTSLEVLRRGEEASSTYAAAVQYARERVAEAAASKERIHAG